MIAQSHSSLGVGGRVIEIHKCACVCMMYPMCLRVNEQQVEVEEEEEEERGSGRRRRARRRTTTISEESPSAFVGAAGEGGLGSVRRAGKVLRSLLRATSCTLFSE